MKGATMNLGMVRSRRSILYASAASLGLMMSACGGDTPATSAQPTAGTAKPAPTTAAAAPVPTTLPAKAAAPVTLRVNHRTEKYIPVRAKKFSDLNPNVTVELVQDSGYEKLIAMLAAGDLGDVVWASTGVGSYFELAAQGHFLNVETYTTKDKYDLKQHFPRAIETARLVDNKLYGMPNLMHPSHIGLFYNVNIFETTQVQPPTLTSSYDDLVDISRKVMAAKQGIWGINTETVYPPILCFIRSFGGEMLDPPTLGKKPALDRGPAKQALQWLYDLRHKHKVHPMPTDKVDHKNGDIAMWTTGMWGGADQSAVADRFKIEAVLIPKGPGGKRGSQGHVDMWALYAKGKNPDVAWSLMKHFVSKEQGVEMMPETNIPGSRPDSWEEFAKRPLFKVFKDFMEADGGPGPLAVPDNFKMLDYQNVFQKEVTPIWAGEKSVDTTVGTMMGPLQLQIDLPKANGKQS